MFMLYFACYSSFLRGAFSQRLQRALIHPPQRVHYRSVHLNSVCFKPVVFYYFMGPTLIYRDLFKNACPVALSFLLHLYCSEQSLWHFFSRPGY